MTVKLDGDHRLHAGTRSARGWHLGLLGIGIGVGLWSGLATLRIQPAQAQATSQASDSPPAATIPGLNPGDILPNLTPLPTQTEEPIHLVVQRSQRRVEVYQGEKKLAQYPIAVGKPGWETPVGEFQVINKEENPIFKNFKTGNIIMPGPDNPLGVRWIGFWTDGQTQIGFHGTNEPELIGQAVSHGCIRMRNKDVTALYKYAKLGTVVTVKP